MPDRFNAKGELPRVSNIESVTIEIRGEAPKNIGGLILALLRKHDVSATVELRTSGPETAPPPLGDAPFGAAAGPTTRHHRE